VDRRQTPSGKDIIKRIPEHKCYCEPFAGAAWVLFNKEPSEAEVLNDINSDIVTLYRVIRFHLREFIEHFKWLLCAREEFQRFMATPPEVLTDIQRAVRFYYIQRQSFGGLVVNPSYSYSTRRGPRLNLLRIEEDLSAAHLRLARVYVEHLTYADVVRRYDRPSTFFYLDPPYFRCEDYYGKGLFRREDFALLRDILSGIKGRFLMSLNDTPEVRQIYKDFVIEEVATRYSCGKANQVPVTEVLIRNYTDCAVQHRFSN
jgi:DNA adenine methylase